jgi:acyl-CoA synthetase (AMP-forming)/AMP-acid ligase II
MRLANILDLGKFNFAANPCVVRHEGDSIRTHILTYASGWYAMREHLQWLRETVAGQDVVVAYLSSNSGDVLLSILASTELGVQVALLNTRWTAFEIAAVLQTQLLTATTIILYGDGFEHKAKQAAEALMHNAAIRPIPTFSESYMTCRCSPHQPAVSAICVDNEVKSVMSSNDGCGDALIVFTSGTTAGSKGVRLSHRALLIQALAKLRPPCRYANDTRMLATTVPLFHVGGLSSALAVWLAGGTLVFPHNPGFDPQTLVNATLHASIPTNTLVVVPAMLHALLHHVGEQRTFPSVDLILIGGQSAPPSMVRQLKSTFPRARLVQTYACTEASSSLTFSLVDGSKESSVVSIPGGPVGDCIGRPHVDMCLFEILDNDKLVEVHEHGKVGVFATRGLHVMSGYWKRGDASMYPSIGRNEWFLTHDLGFKDDSGQFYFCGRAKDVIRTGGETVIASEVERVLLEHEIVDECAVFALPDDRFGEAVCAALVAPRGGQGLPTLAQVRHYCSEQGLSGYKCPRRLFFVKELPRNSSGKIVKHMLVDRFSRSQLVRSNL